MCSAEIGLVEPNGEMKLTKLEAVATKEFPVLQLLIAVAGNERDAPYWSPMEARTVLRQVRHCAGAFQKY